MDKRLPLGSLPPAAAARAAMEITDSLSTEKLLRFHKCGVGFLSDDELSELQNYAYIWNIDGAAWKKDWNMDPDGLEGGKMTDGVMHAKIRTLGTFALAVDDAKPQVTPANFNDNTKVINCKRLKINISDKGSGIDKYDIYLNGKWVIGAFDGKNGLLYYDVDENLKKGSNKMEIVVTDCVGNETRRTYTIVRE